MNAGGSGGIQPDSFRFLGHNVIVFGRSLRALGLAVQPDRLVLLAQALDAIGLHEREDVKKARETALAARVERAQERAASA